MPENTKPPVKGTPKLVIPDSRVYANPFEGAVDAIEGGMLTPLVAGARLMGWNTPWSALATPLCGVVGYKPPGQVVSDVVGSVLKRGFAIPRRWQSKDRFDPSQWVAEDYHLMAALGLGVLAVMRRFPPDKGWGATRKDYQQS